MEQTQRTTQEIPDWPVLKRYVSLVQLWFKKHPDALQDDPQARGLARHWADEQLAIHEQRAIAPYRQAATEVRKVPGRGKINAVVIDRTKLLTEPPVEEPDDPCLDLDWYIKNELPRSKRDKTWNQVADMFGCNLTDVKQWTATDVLKRFKKGHTLTQIADDMRLDPNIVIDAFQIAQQLDRIKRVTDVSPLQMQQAVMAYNANPNIMQIAWDMNIDYRTMVAVLIKGEAIRRHR